MEEASYYFVIGFLISIISLLVILVIKSKPVSTTIFESAVNNEEGTNNPSIQNGIQRFGPGSSAVAIDITQFQGTIEHNRETTKIIQRTCRDICSRKIECVISLLTALTIFLTALTGLATSFTGLILALKSNGVI